MLIDDENNSNIKVTIKEINDLITDTCTKLGLKTIGVKGINKEDFMKLCESIYNTMNGLQIERCRR